MKHLFFCVACALLAVIASAQAPAGPVDGPFVVLAGSDCGSPQGLDLAPTPEGSRAVFRDGFHHFLVDLDRDGAYRTPWKTLEPVADAAPGVRITTAPDGSGVVAWQERSSTPRVFALFFDTEGEVIGSPLLLGTLPSRGTELTLRSVGDGLFALADTSTTTLVLFEAGRLVAALELGFHYDDQDFVRVGDTLWHAGARELSASDFPTIPPGGFPGVVELRGYGLEGQPPGDPAWRFEYDPELESPPGIALGADGLGRLSLALAAPSEVSLHRFDGATGELLSTWDVSVGTLSAVAARVSLAVDPAGNQAVAWESILRQEPSGDSPVIRLSSFLADGTPVRRGIAVADASSTTFDGVLPSSYQRPHVALTGPGEVTVGFESRLDIPIDPVPPCFPTFPGIGLLPEIPLGGDHSLLLQEGRFRMEVDWQDPHNGGSGTGHAVPGTTDAGSFWFFDEDNKEIEIKVLDGRSVNGHFWVFAAGLSDVGYTIRVTDQQTGEERRFVNQPFEFGNFIDTAAFAAPGVSRPPTPPVGDDTLVLSAAETCDPRDPVLAPAADGFFAAWEQRERPYLRRFDANGAPRTRERTLLSQEPVTPVDGAVATAPDSSGLFVHQTGGAVTGELFDAEGEVTAILDLGVVPTDADLLVTHVAGGYVVADTTTGGAVRVAADGTTTFFDLPPSRSFIDLDGTGDVLWYASVEESPFTPSGDFVVIQPLTPLGIPLGEPELLGLNVQQVHGLALTHDERGRIYVAWLTREEVLMQVLGTNGAPEGDVLSVRRFAEPGSLADLETVSDAEGNVLLTWEEASPGSPSRVWASTRLARGVLVLHEPFAGEREAGASLADPTPVLADGGRMILTTRRELPESEASPGCPVAADVLASVRSLGGDDRLLLQQGRFEVLVNWRPPPFTGGFRPGHAVPGSEESGSFWFFDPANKEIEVKVLDGTSINGHFWVFAAGLSNVDYDVIVVDQRTGAHKVYSNTSPDYGNFIDTAAFPSAP